MEPGRSREAETLNRRLGRWQALVSGQSIPLAAFAATLFLSALLLFSVQPMFAKLILPKLGGAPAVWAVSMCFFQAVLLLGYAYAFALDRWLKRAQAPLVHLSFIAVTGFALPFGLPASLGDPPQGDAYLWLIELLAIGVGLPFFAVSANAPLLQAWFARTSSGRAADPYFLYGASNLGSLIALLAYPLLVEPTLGLGAQSVIWSAGFRLLAVMVGISGMMMLANRAPAAWAAATPAATGPAASVRALAGRRLRWVALAFVPSSLVIAVTTYITTDVASAPFLWVLPLALFLATFILVFRAELPFSYKIVCEMMPAVVLLYVLTQGKLISSLFALASFFLAAVICHRELYLLRPAPERLPEFYLWMSVGGVLGGVFSALIAPRLFVSIFEFPLLTLLALLCRPGVLSGRDEPVSWWRLAGIVGAGLALMAAFKLAVHWSLLSTDRLYLFALIGLLCIGLLSIRKWPEHRAALVFTMIAAAALRPGDLTTIDVERSFFGTHRVILSDDGDTRILLHGTTVHGTERIKDATGQPVAATAPGSYYHPTSPMARGAAAARSNLLAQGKPLRVGIVGLGAGSLAYYCRSGEAWRYFEIDPVVARIATDPALFDFFGRCTPRPDVVIGDARLTLTKETAQEFGYLVIDAFSSDSIPVHLMTVEALRLYLDKLDPDGLLALHISNRHLDLLPSLVSSLALIADVSAAVVYDPRSSDDLAMTASEVVFVARRAQALAPVLAWSDARPLPHLGDRPWTDDYSDVLSAMLRHLGQ